MFLDSNLVFNGILKTFRVTCHYWHDDTFVEIMTLEFPFVYDVT